MFKFQALKARKIEFAIQKGAALESVQSAPIDAHQFATDKLDISKSSANKILAGHIAVTYFAICENTAL